MSWSSLILKRSTGKNISSWDKTNLNFIHGTPHDVTSGMRSLPKYVLESQNKRRFFCCCCFTHALYVCVSFHSSHALTADVSIEETARAAQFFLSDGVIITGAATGVQANPEEFRGTVWITVELLWCSITLLRMALVRKFSSSKRNCLTVIKSISIMQYYNFLFVFYNRKCAFYITIQVLLFNLTTCSFFIQPLCRSSHRCRVITFLNKLIFVSQQEKPRLMTKLKH